MNSKIITYSVYTICIVSGLSFAMSIATAFYGWKFEGLFPNTELKTLEEKLTIKELFSDSLIASKPKPKPKIKVKAVLVLRHQESVLSQTDRANRDIYPGENWSNNVTYYRGEKITITTDDNCQIFYPDGNIDLPIGTFEYQITRDEPLYFKNKIDNRSVNIQITYKKDRDLVERRDKDYIFKITKNFIKNEEENDMSKEEWTNNCIMRKGDKILIVYDCRDCIMSCINKYRLKGKDTLETTIAKNGLLKLRCTANSKLEIYF